MTWYQERIPLLNGRIRARLNDLPSHLGDGEWLDGVFSVGDLMMVMVLRRLEGMNLLEAYPSLTAYVAKGKARPAFRRAFEDQLAVFRQRR